MTTEDKLLGKQVEYPQHYCPAILVAVPRRQNREIYGIDHPDRLFCGYDSWHAYEASFILDNGSRDVENYLSGFQSLDCRK